MSGPARDREPGDGWIDRCVEGFHQPVDAVDETPRGRMAGMDRDSGLVIAEMRELLTSRVSAISRDVRDQRLAELLEQFGDMHERREQTHGDLIGQLIERHYSK